MTLGLLEGYDHVFIESGAKRRRKYLKESPYIVNSNGKNDVPYDEADEDLKNAYEDRLIKTENKLLLEMADYMIEQLHCTEDFLSDISNYMNDGVAIFPTPGYIKRKQTHNWLDIILNYLFMGIKFSKGKGRASLNENKEYEMNVPLPEKFIITATALMMILCIFSALPYLPQKNNSYVSTAETAKHDYTETPLAKRELPNID